MGEIGSRKPESGARGTAKKMSLGVLLALFAWLSVSLPLGNARSGVD